LVMMPNQISTWLSQEAHVIAAGQGAFLGRMFDGLDGPSAHLTAPADLRRHCGG